jgi:uncharacterized membrane protein (DUF4010 family)
VIKEGGGWRRAQIDAGPLPRYTPRVDTEPLAGLAVALVAGMLIGLEREQSAPEAGRQTFLGGARTFPLVAVLGGLAGLLAPPLGGWLVVLPLLGILGIAGVAFTRDTFAGREAGLTSGIALAISYVLGVLAVTQGVIEPISRRAVAVAAVAVVTTLVLSLKPTLHGLATHVSRDDLFALVKFLIVAVVVLPLLPDRTMGPLDVINPFQVGLLVVLIAGLGFAGYVAVRLLGPGRGLGVTGLVGGLVSSTAVTVSMATRARREPELLEACAMAIVIASTIMAVRIGVLVQVTNPSLLPTLIVPLAVMVAAGALGSLWFFLRTRGAAATSQEVALENPMELAAAARFALVFVVVLLATKAATQYLGNAGTYLAGLLAGTTDVDAITLSMARLSREGLDAQVASNTILLGAASNTVVKGVLAAWLGGLPLGLRVGGALAAMLAGAGAALAIAWIA